MKNSWTTGGVKLAPPFTPMDARTY